jgi:hypothetical protein
VPYIGPSTGGGGGGSGTVTDVTSTTTAISVANGTTTPALTVATLDVVAADGPPAADWSNNSHKITSLANGSSAQDAVAFGQIPTTPGAVGAMPALSVTAVKTSGYPAAADEFVPCDTTSAAFTVTLPTAPADGTIVGVKLVIQGSGNAVTIATGGSDVFNVASGATTSLLLVLSQAKIFQYENSTGIWYEIANDLPILTGYYYSLQGNSVAIAAGGNGYLDWTGRTTEPGSDTSFLDWTDATKPTFTQPGVYVLNGDFNSSDIASGESMYFSFQMYRASFGAIALVGSYGSGTMQSGLAFGFYGQSSIGTYMDYGDYFRYQIYNYGAATRHFIPHSLFVQKVA